MAVGLSLGCRSITCECLAAPVAWQGVCLIDYGRSVDLTLFPPNTRFLAHSGTDSFRCPAMLDSQPWRFEVCASVCTSPVVSLWCLCGAPVVYS